MASWNEEEYEEEQRRKVKRERTWRRGRTARQPWTERCQKILYANSLGASPWDPGGIRRGLTGRLA